MSLNVHGSVVADQLVLALEGELLPSTSPACRASTRPVSGGWRTGTTQSRGSAEA
jgi:hypothetical protein